MAKPHQAEAQCSSNDRLAGDFLALALVAAIVQHAPSCSRVESCRLLLERRWAASLKQWGSPMAGPRRRGAHIRGMCACGRVFASALLPFWLLAGSVGLVACCQLRRVLRRVARPHTAARIPGEPPFQWCLSCHGRRDLGPLWWLSAVSCNASGRVGGVEDQ